MYNIIVIHTVVKTLFLFLAKVQNLLSLNNPWVEMHACSHDHRAAAVVLLTNPITIALTEAAIALWLARGQT